MRELTMEEMGAVAGADATITFGIEGVFTVGVDIKGDWDDAMTDALIGCVMGAIVAGGLGAIGGALTGFLTSWEYNWWMC